MNQASRTRASQISHINPVPDTRAASLISQDTFADLAELIMATDLDQPAAAGKHAGAGHSGTGRAGSGRTQVRRRLLVGIPATAVIAAAAVAVTVIAKPGQKVGPVSIGPAKAQALSFTRDGRYIDVIVRNPVADEATYLAEFAAHHMHITLSLVAVPKDMTGQLVYMGTPNNGGGITPITAKGKCLTDGGGQCPVGVRVPVDFHGQAEFTFGRPARPGEQYESTDQQDAPGEPLHGLNYIGKTVAVAIPMLHSRHENVYQFRYMSAGSGLCGMLPKHIPGDYVVYMSVPWAQNEILLWVGPAAGGSGHHCGTMNSTRPGSAAPVPSASPTGS